MENSIKEFEKIIGYEFKNQEYIKLALTHTSYTNEHQIEKTHSNQRIEFLGDAVVELVTSNFVYRRYPDVSEGELTKIRAKLVCEESLADVAYKLSFNKFLRIGKGDPDLARNKSVLCDTFEAVVGAIYLDSNIDTATKFITRHLFTEDKLSGRNIDYKTELQEYMHKLDKKLEYRCLEEKGPDHEKVFTMALYIDDEFISKAEGSTKKQAEQFAAEIGIKLLNLGVD